MSKSSQLLFLLLFPLVLTAQEENWDVYIADYEGRPGSTVLNMALRSSAPFTGLPFVCITGVKFSDCNPDDLPASRAFPELYKISDSIKNAIGRFVKNTLAGTFSHQCERLDYYYVSDTVGLRNMLLGVYRRFFPSYTPYINVRADAKWEAYLDFLYPGEKAFEYMQNQKVVMQLHNAGDNLSKERQVDHWLYFKTGKDRDCFINYALLEQYKIVAKETIEEGDNKFKLQIARTDLVQLGVISKITLGLRRQAKKCNGDYDGWETFVIKD